jgi:hypothetical protein
VRRLSLSLFVVALLVATVGALVVTESLKLNSSLIGTPQFTAVFSPGCHCPTRKAVLSFRLDRPDRVDLAVVSDGRVVRTLLEDAQLSTGRVRVRWNGKDDSGAIVPDGVYRLRVRFRKADRTIVIPVDIEVDSQPSAPAA